MLCAAEGDDETFAAMVIRLGAYHLEYRGTRAWLIGLRDLLSAHAWSEHEAAMTPASTARVPDEELTFGPDLVVMHDGAPFTGVAFEETPDGVVSECAYVEGYQDGVSRDVYPEGTIKATTEYRHGERHGLSREYGPHGGLVTEESYERGVRLWAVEVSPDGTRVVTFRIDADGATSQHLARLRARESAADRRPSPSEGGEGT